MAPPLPALPSPDASPFLLAFLFPLLTLPGAARPAGRPRFSSFADADADSDRGARRSAGPPPSRPVPSGLGPRAKGRRQGPGARSLVSRLLALDQAAFLIACSAEAPESVEAQPSSLRSSVP